MRRIRTWLPIATLIAAIFVAQGAILLATAPSVEADASVPKQALTEIMREDGPVIERIPAPYVVLTILGGSLAAMGVWYALVRWTDISEAF